MSDKKQVGSRSYVLVTLSLSGVSDVTVADVTVTVTDENEN